MGRDLNSFRQLLMVLCLQCVRGRPIAIKLSCPCFLRERMSSFPPSGQGSGGDGGAALDLTNYGDTQQYYETYEQ